MAADMFMKVTGAKSGPIKGESQEPSHQDEIEVISWNWALLGNASATVGTSGRTAQVAARELVFFKRADNATTGLMSALSSNEKITSAVLTVRKAGGAAAVEYLKVTLQDARIRSIEIEAGARNNEELVVEKVALGFQTIEVEYKKQSAQGGAAGTSSFRMQLNG